MQNKSKSWNDIQLVISSISVALTLGLWSYFSSSQKMVAGVTADVNFPNQPDPTAAGAATNPAVSNNDILLPGQVLLLNGANLAQPSPATATQTTQSPTVQTKKNKGGGNSGGSVTKTSSSHP
jgi:hypothetical protein